jgi:2-keto-3-deoxy-L-rhamnonate aldolase RhmA
MGLSHKDMGPGSEHEAAIMEVLAACKKTDKAAGKHCFTSSEVSQRIQQGFQFLALMSDAALMSKAAREEFNAVDFSGGGGSGDQEAKGTLY